MTIGKTTASITAQNTGTDWIDVNQDAVITVSGTFSATITLQKRFGTSGSAIDIEEYTSTAHKLVQEVEDGVQYRLFCKTGAFTSGTAELRISY